MGCVTLKMNLLQICRAIRALPIEDAWFLYVAALQQSKWGAQWWKFDPWQHYDILWFFRKRTGGFRRARGGSKTRDMSAILIFLRIRGLPCFWYAAYRKQIMRAQEYWSYNPFVTKFRIAINRQVIYTIEFQMIEIAVLNSGNSKGPRAAVLFYDEMAMMSPELVDDTEGITNGMGDEIYKCYGSTPVINTVFQIKCSMHGDRVHPWYHMKWFSPEEIHSQKKTMAPAKWRQENLAHFTAMDGQVFEANLRRGQYLGKLNEYTYYGSDPNPREGYVVVGGQFSTDGMVFQITFAKNFGPNAKGKNAMIDYLLTHQKATWKVGGIEIEANGVGKPVCDDAAEAGLIFAPCDWNAVNKITRINDMCKLMIFIPKDRIFNPLWNQMSALQWSVDGSKVDKLRGNPYHFVDSAIHACQPNFEGDWKWH